jgi:NAD/NADP transhydrogenase beta subunit
MFFDTTPLYPRKKNQVPQLIGLQSFRPWSLLHHQNLAQMAFELDAMLMISFLFSVLKIVRALEISSMPLVSQMLNSFSTWI